MNNPADLSVLLCTLPANQATEPGVYSPGSLADVTAQVRADGAVDLYHNELAYGGLLDGWNSDGDPHIHVGDDLTDEQCAESLAAITLRVIASGGPILTIGDTCYAATARNEWDEDDSEHYLLCDLLRTCTPFTGTDNSSASHLTAVL